MKYSKTGFRSFYHNYVAVPMKDDFKNMLCDFPEAEKANCILTYGYIDRTAGFTLEILAAAIKKDDKFYFADTSIEISSKIRIASVMEDECFYFDDEDGHIYDRYKEKIDALEAYSVSEEVEESRRMTFLDEFRNSEYPDDVLVRLLKDGNQVEACWVRIEALEEHQIIGTLLDEPYQNFSYHKGEKIAFFVYQTENEKIVLCSNMNPSAKITAKDLEDGSMLESAIHAFNNERNKDHLLDILEILRDSYVWIPCNAVMSEDDQARLLAMTKEKEDGIIGEKFVTHDQIRLIPDILQNGEAFFFPAFSNNEAMGEYGKSFSKVQKHFLEVISLAVNNDRELAGIVINAFTEPFVLDKEIWDIVTKMKSRIADN